MSAFVALALSAPALELKAEPTESDSAYYFLLLHGQGMPVKQIILNGTNVLGGSVVSQSMPINVTEELKAGQNDLELDMVSHPTDGFTTIVQKRIEGRKKNEGPKIVEIARIAVNASENQGRVVHKAITFNIDSEINRDTITTISDSDREKILALVRDYHSILKSKNTGKFRKLYEPALERENKIFPEGARFFQKVLDREVVLLKNPKIELGSFESTGIALEPEGDKVKVCRKGSNKPLMESNEIEVETEPLFVELDDQDKKEDKRGKEAKSNRTAKPTAKQRLVTTKLLFRKIDGDWQLALPQGS